jgi:beta-lactamase regulating signal transducer with metallopeptidase domain
MTTTLLFEWALKGALLLGAAAVALRGMHQAPANLRRFVLATAVVGTLALPLAPRWLPLALPAAAPLPAASLAEAAPALPVGARLAAEPTAASMTAAAPANTTSSSSAWLVGLWAAGALLLLARLGLDHARARALKRRARATADGVAFSDEIDTPMVVGVWRPTILMPADAGNTPAPHVAASLAHERAHLANHDTRLVFLADVLRALRWFDPLAYWAARRLRAECELAADDAVLAGGVRPSEYAALLLSLATPRLSPSVAPTVALGAGGAGVRERIERVLDGRRRAPKTRQAWTVGVLGGLFAAAVGCAGPAVDAAEPAPIAAPGAAIRQPIVGLDEVVQAKVTEELFKLQADEAPLAASVVVVEVETGRVLALAGVGPQGDETAQEGIEPASVLKALTAAAALEAGVTPQRRFTTGATLEVGGHVLKDAQPASALDLESILAQSSNIGAARLAETVGPAALQNAFARFGVTPANTPAWSPLQAALGASGVGLLARPVDIARAYATLGNGGVDPLTGDAIVSGATAGAVCRLLEAAVEHGTGQGALVDDLRLGGKTGTLTVRGPEGDREADLTRASFAGLVPIDAPRWAIHVRVDTRAAGATGGRVAAPLFRRIALALSRDC